MKQMNIKAPPKRPIFPLNPKSRGTTAAAIMTT